MTHPVDLAATPKAAAPLASLFVATRTAPTAGAATRPDRLKLARAVGAGELAELLKGDAPIQVRPRAGDVWEVHDMTETTETAVGTLARVLTAEVSRQGISHRELARRAGEVQQTVSRLLGGQTDPKYTTLRAVLDGLGKSLTWLDRQLNQTPEPPTG
ncbi:MAG: helix-turn-helix transcriptional regulator [Gemmataceae bacterium]